MRPACITSRVRRPTLYIKVHDCTLDIFFFFFFFFNGFYCIGYEGSEEYGRKKLLITLHARSHSPLRSLVKYPGLGPPGPWFGRIAYRESYRDVSGTASQLPHHQITQLHTGKSFSAHRVFEDVFTSKNKKREDNEKF